MGYTIQGDFNAVKWNGRSVVFSGASLFRKRLFGWRSVLWTLKFCDGDGLVRGCSCRPGRWSCRWGGCFCLLGV